MSLFQDVRKSLFLRLLAIFGATVIAFSVIIYVSVRTINQNANTIEAIPDFFTRNVEAIIEDIGTPPNLANAVRLSDELEWIINIRNPIMRWSSVAEDRLDVDSSQFSRSLSQDAEVRTINSEDVIRVQREGYDFYMYPRSLNSSGVNFLVFYIGLALAGVVLFFNYFMVNKLLSPVRLLKSGAERIRRGDLSFRVDSNRQDELGELTESINHMADSLQSMLEAKRQLLLAISHELRTPITKAKLRMEFMPSSEEKEQLKEDIEEIELLISDLIEAERLNQDHSVLVSEQVQFGDFVSQVLEQYESYEGGLEQQLPQQDFSCELDKLRVRLLITNLLNNAIRHGEAKPIRVVVKNKKINCTLEVIDLGEGIPENHLAQITEPFYRADSARQRNTGGFGLGLYLCRLIAEAHGGSLHIASKLGEGTHITVTLPRRPTQAIAG
ncbi:MAG: HAMP domain-containing sensor histidine kinase [Gammaproteobacteria bacterium]